MACSCYTNCGRETANATANDSYVEMIGPHYRSMDWQLVVGVRPLIKQLCGQDSHNVSLQGTEIHGGAKFTPIPCACLGGDSSDSNVVLEPRDDWIS